MEKKGEKDMNEALRAKCDLLANNRDAVKKGSSGNEIS